MPEIIIHLRVILGSAYTVKDEKAFAAYVAEQLNDSEGDRMEVALFSDDAEMAGLEVSLREGTVGVTFESSPAPPTKDESDH